MAATALAERDLVAAKLEESVRQLRRYIISGGKSKRILEKRCKNVESEKDELLEIHHRYAEKSGTPVDDEAMKEFINPKLDAAEDALNEAIDVLDDLGEDDLKENMKTEAEKNIREGAMNEEILRYMIDEVSKILVVETPTPDDVIKVEHFLVDIEKKEALLEMSFGALRGLVEEEAAEEYSKKEISLKRLISNTYAKMKWFIKKNTKVEGDLKNDELKDEEAVSGVRSTMRASLRLEKIKPPRFCGEIRNFARFKADFEAIVKPAYKDEMHLNYVLKESCLSGVAYELVRNVESVDEIWERLEERYGDAIDIVDSVIRDLQGVTINKFSQDRGMVQLVDVLEKGVRDLTAIDKRKEIANAYTVKLLEKKFPRRVMMKWLDAKDKNGETDRFEALFMFLKQERKCLEKLIQQGGEGEKGTGVKDNAERRKMVNALTDRRIGDGQKSYSRCLIHQNSNHLTRKCKLFLDKSVRERDKLVKERKACSLCLSSSHIGSPCPWMEKWNPCDVNGCGEYHSRLLHDNHYLKPNCKATSDGDRGTLLLVQKVKGEKNDVIIFWDSGSSISLVKKDYAYRCKLSGINVSYELVTLGNVPKLQNTVLFDVPIFDFEGKKHVIRAYAIEEICSGDEGVDVRDVVGEFTNLRPNEVQRRNYDVDLLVGMDYAHLQPVPIERRKNLVLYSSRFGTGKLLGGQHNLIRGGNEVNLFAKTVAHARSVKIEVLKPRTEVDFFTAESLGVNVPPKCRRCKNCKECTFETNQLSRCEQRELEVIRQNLVLDPVQNKWITTYPYKTDPSVLRDNRGQAEAFLQRTERRLGKNAVVRDQYCQQFKGFVDRNVFREISDEEISQYEGPTFYITHHEVYKEESASTPLRIVSNTSLKNPDGVSLNDVLMKGPNSLNNLFGIQIRFRTNTIALVGDIAKMYNSIATTVKERHLRRLLWRDLKVDERPRTYGVETVMFGDKPAAAISATAISQTAEIFKYVDEGAAEKIQKDIYVDDIATGDVDVTKTLKLKESITEILSKGGFHVKGFVMSGDSSEEKLSLLGTGEVGRILGIGWKPREDVFVVRVRINISKKFKGARKELDLDDAKILALTEGKLTRRMLLSITNSCYDPLGIVSPITVQLKIELRKLYSKELGLSWDDDIPHEMKLVWIKLIKRLKSIEGVEFGRCVQDPDSQGDPELVVFCDGSPLAMCAVAYIRWELRDGRYSSFLFSAKTRVTPLERQTIPRVEMQSAVIAVRLANSIIKHSKYNFRDVSYISDSACTLATLKKDSTALKEYMGNRVAEVNALSTASQWYHAKSQDNIADLGTRMEATARDVDEESDWQRGPAWLREDRSCWPVFQDVDDVMVPEDELLRKGLCYFNEKEDVLMDVAKYPSYSFLMNVTARILSVLERKSFKVDEVTVSSLKAAERYWLRQSMKHTKEELEKGKLLSLRPIVDKDGIIVIASRALEGLKHHYNTDSFPILTQKDPLAALWVKEVHEEDHSGVTRTVAKSRRKFWIVRARRVAQKVRYSCYRCRLLDKKLETQLMSPLPMFRQSISPVFYVTSIDLFGPFMVKDMVKKRTKMKVWGLVATCASTRAVHLDLADGYGTDAVIQTLRKFVALRGCPSKFISDQGSQLKSAAKDTAEVSSDWDWTNVEKWATSNKILWEFVPADSQHKNGLSESMVKSVKRSIMHVIGGNVLSFSEFQLMLYEVANIVNSRPIGVISGEDPECPNPITPNDLILGRSTNEVPQGPFETKPSVTRRFLFVQTLIDEWWKTWFISVLPSLVPSYKWLHKCRNVKLGDICLIGYKGGLRSTYRLGRVVGVHHGDDGLVRKVKLEYKLTNEKVFRTVERSIHGVAVIVPIEEQNDLVHHQRKIATVKNK